MKTNLNKKIWIAIAASAVLSIGCGAKPNRQVAGDEGGYAGGGSPGQMDPGIGTGGGDDGDDTANTNPSITFSFGLNTTRDSAGNPIGSWTSPDITTDTLLKVKVRPGSAGALNVPGSGFVANYGCIQYSVTVGAQTITTPKLAVNGGSSACPGAPTEVTLDFSSRLTPGHGPMKVTVSDARYDFYCVACYAYPWLYNAQWYGCNNYCPVRPLYKNHSASGTLSIQVNGTSLD